MHAKEVTRFKMQCLTVSPDGGGTAAREVKPGSWRGYISYTMQGNAFNLKRFWAEGSGIEFRTVNLNHSMTSRPDYPEYLETYFDKKTNKTLTWNGKIWVDAMGNPAD